MDRWFQLTQQMFERISRLIQLLEKALKRVPKPVLHMVLGVCLGTAMALLMLMPRTNIFGRLLDRLELATLDSRYEWQIKVLDPPTASIEDIIIVDIDRWSNYKMGNYLRWPRSYHADVIDHMAQDGARIIALDMLFEGEEEDENDRRLAEAVKNAGNVYTAVFLLPADDMHYRPVMEKDPYAPLNPNSAIPVPESVQQSLYTQDVIEGPFPSMARNASGLVAVTTSPDEYGINRRVPLVMNFKRTTYPSLNFRVAMEALGVPSEEVEVEPGRHIRLGRKRTIPIDKRGLMLLRYYGPSGAQGATFRYISYYNVWQKRFPPGTFTDKIVLVGGSLPGIGDLHTVPFSSDYPGVEIHATAIRNILTNDFLIPFPTRETWWFTGILGILVSCFTFMLRPLKSAVLTLVIMLGYFILTIIVFVQFRVWIEVIRPEGTILFAYMATMLVQYLTEERERRWIESAFGKFVSPDVVAELKQDPSRLNLGGERREVTMMFSDLQDFTTISEELEPEEVIALLNEYLTEMSDIILDHDGMIDKYEGDCILAVFGAPALRADHAARACLAAVEMRDKLVEIRTRWVGEGKPPFYARTGINTGEVIVGIMGSKMRMDYTVTGDHANLASRLEGANKQYKTNIMISETTYEQARDRIHVRELDLIRVKGKRLSLKVYEILGGKEDLLPEDRIRVAEQFEHGLTAYRAQQWDEAEAAFRAALKIDPCDGPSQVFMDRCKVYRLEPPPPGWDGTFEMETK